MSTSNLRKPLLALLAALTLLGVVAGNALAAPGDTTRVSVSSSGNQTNNSSLHSSISADGRYVAFESRASNLVAGDTNAASDIFVKDRQTGATERVSVGSAGNQGNSDSSRRPSISADGRFVAFVSFASNLVAGDTNGVSDIFVHDRLTGSTQRVNVGSSGTQSNNFSDAPSISADGRYVAFESTAFNLVAGDTNGSSDIFVKDRQSGVTERVSVSSANNQANGFSGEPSISADGRFVAFRSLASGLVAGDTNAASDIFVKDRQTGTTDRVSVSSAGNQSNRDSTFASISADGRFVAFNSAGSNLVAGDTNGSSDIFVKDRQSGVTERVSVSSANNQANGFSGEPSISANGRFVVFNSTGSNLVSGDTGGFTDTFVRDRQSNTTERVSVSSAGNQGNNSSTLEPSISADGRFVAFASFANNLVAGDTNGFSDIFVHERDGADVTPPDAPSTPDLDAASDTGRFDTDNITNDNTPTLTGTAGDGSTVDIFVDGVKQDSGVATGGSYLIMTTAIADGPHTITAKATDAAGNTSTESDALEVTIDTAAPVLNLSDVTVDATSPEGAVVTYSASATDNLDQNPSVECAPLSGNTFPIGPTTVSCVAVDVSGNSASESFDVTVKGATEQIADLKDLVTSLGLPAGLNTSLQTKLDDALAAADAGDTATACGELNAFTNQVRAQSGKKIPVSDANDLIAEANRIKAVLGC